jgi:DNA replication ATP-dependent helicase Dna2
MNEDIMLLSNELVYNGKLKVGNSEIAQKELHLPSANSLVQAEAWLRDVLEPR